MAIELGDRVVDLRAGDLALLDFSKGVKMTPKGLFSHVSIPLPRELFKGLERARFGKLSTTGGCGQLLGTLVRQVAGGELAHWSCPQDGDGVQRALVALLESVLEYRASDHSPGWQFMKCNRSSSSGSTHRGCRRRRCPKNLEFPTASSTGCSRPVATVFAGTFCVSGC